MAAIVVTSSSGKRSLDNLIKVLIDGADDLETIQDDAAPGSVAYSADGTLKYTKAPDGTWKRTTGGGGGGGGGSVQVTLSGHTLVIQ